MGPRPCMEESRELCIYSLNCMVCYRSDDNLAKIQLESHASSDKFSLERPVPNIPDLAASMIYPNTTCMTKIIIFHYPND